MVLVSWILLYIFSAFRYPPHIPRTKKHNVLLPTAMNCVICQVNINKQLQLWNVCSLYRCQNSSSYTEKWRSALTVVQQQTPRWFHHTLRKVGTICVGVILSVPVQNRAAQWCTNCDTRFEQLNTVKIMKDHCSDIHVLITIENIVYYCKDSLRF
jgi:hypothetical protein